MKLIAILLTAFLICSCTSAPASQPFTVDLLAPRFEIGKAESYFNKLFSSKELDKEELTLFYHPVDDVIGTEFSPQLLRACLYWNKPGREAFIKAFERYKNEFDQRTLITKGKKTREAYGWTDGFFVWKRTSISPQAYGSLKVFFGYQFKDNAAFFTVTQMETEYVDPISRSRNQTSQVVMIYFTKAQAEGLAALFSQEYVDSVRGANKTPSAVQPDLDKY